MPRPSSPTRRAQVPRYSTSLEAFERLPSLSLSRWRWKGLRLPSGRQRGTQKQVMRSPSVFARVRKPSLMGAEQNHLCPVSSKVAPPPPASRGRARVVLARTSLPPCFSVIAMPTSAARLSSSGHMRGSYSVPTRRGSSASASSGSWRRAGTQAKVMVSGQHEPASTWASRKSSAERATWAPGPGRRQGRQCTSWRMASAMISCHAGWKRTSSMRCP